MAQLFTLLHTLHNKGYIYRDFKTSNIIINTLGQVTLIDLGEAKHIMVNQNTIK